MLFMITPNKCPICQKVEVNVATNSHNDTYTVNCPRCGKFFITEEASSFSDITKKIEENANELSGLSRLLHETGGKPFLITTTNIDEIISDSLIPENEDIEEKSKKLLLAIRRKTKFFGDDIRLSFEQDESLAFTLKTQEFIALIKLLSESGLVQIIVSDTGGLFVRVEGKGWNLFKAKDSEQKQGFIAIWFNDSMENNIKTIESAIKETGNIPMCIKNEHYPETIMDKALGEIRRSKFMIVDLTAARPSVFFEAGFGLGLGIEIIYIQKNDGKGFKEFYSKNYKIYEYSTDSELKEILIDAIRGRGLSLLS
jgi:hypothetical protein